VFCAYTSSKGRTLIDAELYLPKSWTEDRERCREAAIPDDAVFATKATLAKKMLARALEAGVPARWVTADEAYGGDYKFRSWCEDQRIGYVVAVPRNQTIPITAGCTRADHLVAQAPSDAWKRLSCGAGAKGPRKFDWAVASLLAAPWTTPAGWSRWLLARRALTPNTKGELEVAYYLCCAPTGTSDDELIRVAGTRWSIEDCFQTAKTDVGLDHYQVRRYDAWYRHITLAMLAHTYLAVTAAISPKALAAASSHSPSAKSAVFWHT
jgi:SRSO17 transposase